MYEGCFLQTRVAKTLNISVDLKTRPSFCFTKYGHTFEKLGQAFEGLRENSKLGRELEKLGRVFEMFGRVCMLKQGPCCHIPIHSVYLQMFKF